MASILVVDESPGHRHFLSSLLSNGEHRLFEASNGEQALELASREKPDVVITDILTGTLDGCDFVQRLRAAEDLSGTQVIFYTGTYNAPEARAIAATCGVRFVLQKPSESDDIMTAINATLGVADSPDRMPRPERSTTHSNGLDSALERYLCELRSIKMDLNAMFDDGGKLRASPKHVARISMQLTNNVTGLQSILARLSAVIGIGTVLIAEHDPERVAGRFFKAVSDLIGSKYAAMGILDARAETLELVFAKGVDAGVFRANGAARPLTTLLAEDRLVHVKDAEAIASLELPASHPLVRDVLAKSIASTDRVYGWLLFADSSGELGFVDEDERLLELMASKLALLYEKAVRYDVIQRHAARLQVERAQRATERSTRAIRVIAADRHRVHEGAARQLRDLSDIQVVGEASDIAGVLAVVAQQPAELVILDVELPGGGLNIIGPLRRLRSELAVIVLGAQTEDRYAVEAVKAGASGYLDRNATAEEMIDAVRKVAAGGRYIPPAVAELLARELQKPVATLHRKLSARELQILRLIGSARSARQIAEELSISINTVNTHRARIFEKMGLRSNSELIRYSIENHLA